MVAHHEDRRLPAVAVEDVAHHGVEPLIESLDVLEISAGLGAAIACGCVLVEVPPEHVRLQVTAGEIEEQQPVVVVVHRIFEQRQPLFEHHRGLPDEFVVGEHAVGSGLVVFLETGGVEQPELVRDVLARIPAGSDICTAGADGSMLIGVTYRRKLGDTSCR